MQPSSFDPDRAPVAAKAMSQASSELSSTWVSGLQTQQTTAKWGTQPSAQQFMSDYITALGTICRKLDLLSAQADDLAASTRQITTDATETDAQAAKRMKFDWDNKQCSPFPTPPSTTGPTVNNIRPRHCQPVLRLPPTPKLPRTHHHHTQQPVWRPAKPRIANKKCLG